MRKLILVALPAMLLAGCSLPVDKALHIGAGAGIAGLGTGLGFSWRQSCALSVAAGVGKEAYDHRGHGHVDKMDAIATAAAGCALAYALDRVIQNRQAR